MVLGHALDQSGLKWSPPEHFFQNMAKRCQKNAIGQLSQRLDEYVEMNIELNIFLDKVWLNTPTSDPTREKEHCSIPKCSHGYDEWSPYHESFVQCQEGIPLGILYDGNSDVTIDGTACQPWNATQPHKHNFTACLLYTSPSPRDS